MKYIYDPPIIPLRKGDFENSPLFKGGRGDLKLYLTKVESAVYTGLTQNMKIYATCRG